MPPNQYPVNDRQSLKIAIIGQSTFAVDVFHRLRQHGHQIVGVFTVPDKGRKEDPLAKIAKEYDVPLFKIKTWRKSGQILPEIYELYTSINVDLNVLPYCSQFIPMEVINHPQFKSICYHPSLLPRHRGASSINWTLICGDKKAGFSIFWADDGLDTGPILLQEECDVYVNDTVDTLYKRFLYPNGVQAMAQAVDMVANGKAPRVVQNEKFATYEPMLTKLELQQIDFNQTALQIHNFVRGMDSVPGARCQIKLPTTGEVHDVQLFGSTLWKCQETTLKGSAIEIVGCCNSGVLNDDGLLIMGNDGNWVNIKHIRINNRMKLAKDLLKIDDNQQIEFNGDELVIVENLRKIWENILNIDIDEGCDFFQNGGGSMDVVRLIEEIKEFLQIDFIENEDLFMAPIFDEFTMNLIKKLRNCNNCTKQQQQIEFNGIELDVNNLNFKIPTQLFINGEFIDADNSKTLPIINPHDESVICHVQCASADDVNKAVTAAKRAFEDSEWSRISPRERGQLLYKLADLMYEHKEILATIESIDSGAVYTLALKTHIGMSIETWRYFAGWCDKIHGQTIPITNARPNHNLTITKREPIGVCGLITPWNYPLMMLSWKMAACLAAGNTVIIKPAQVCPLTALKFAELTRLAGIPPGVINIVPGTGRTTGDAILKHPHIRKIGFTGSTEIGKIVMRQCADSNLKKVSLELGGKSPLIICTDCDLDKAVRLGMQSVFFNKGENCIAAGRLFVEDSIHDEFVRRVVYETRKLQIGDPLKRSTAHGPQNHRQHLEKLLEFIEIGVKEGAHLEYGGQRLNCPGFYLQPTIFTNVEDHMFIAKEESFGPIMIISRFNNGDLEGVLKRANATEYGLASGIFTKDISKALNLAERIDAGTVFINTYNKTDVAAPFGGFKQSGFGKDLGQEALNEYLKTKCITIEY